MKKVIVTIGPSIFKAGRFGIEDSQNHIYRINGAHGTIQQVEQSIQDIRSEFGEVDILIDLPGNKIRTANLDCPIALKKDETFELLPGQSNFDGLFKLLKKGDRVLADDSTLQFVVENTGPDKIVFVPETDGFLLNGKGLHVQGIGRNLPFFFKRDYDLIEVINKYKPKFVGLSFVRNAEDVRTARDLIPEGELIAKIEIREAVDNLNEILQCVEFILIDRGDLSADVGLRKVPSYQRFIVNRALFYNKRIFLATQFLRNMVDKPVPSIAEVIDLYNSFKMGIYGVQLSEETAIGKYPGNCLEVIKTISQEIDSEVIK